MTDGKKSVRLGSFDTALLGAMQASRNEQTGISLTNCQVKKARDNTDLEIVANKHSLVQSSPKKFKLSPSLPDHVGLGDLYTFSINQDINVTIKVSSISALQTVTKADGKHLTKQDCIIGDGMAACRVGLWEKDVDCFKDGCSYTLTAVGVRKYAQKRLWSMTQNTEIVEIDDIGDTIHEMDDSDNDHNHTTVHDEIDTVEHCEEYLSCKLCRAKMTKCTTGILAVCSKSTCAAKTKVSKCNRSSIAKVVIKDNEGFEYKVTVFDNVLSTIIEGINGDSLDEKLLFAPPMKFSFDSRNVVVSVTKL